MLKSFIVALTSLAFLSCGSADNSSDQQKTYDDVQALVSLYDGLGGIINSDFATCANSGATADPLINKICQIAQAATEEEKIQILAQLGAFQAALGNEIEQIKIDLINEASAVDGEIVNINSIISNLTSAINDPTSGLVALQAAIASLTRNRYVLIKSPYDFPGCDPVGMTCPAVITLDGNTDYEINGQIDIGTSRLELEDGAQVYGLNNFSDGITYTGSGNMFANVSNGGFIVRNLRIVSSTASSIVFNVAGDNSTRIYINNNYFFNCYSLGKVSTANSIWFYNNESNSTTATIGMVVDGTVSYLNFSNNTFTNTSNSNLTTMLQIATGTFSTIRISNNSSLSDSSYTDLRAFNIIVPSPILPAVSDGKFTNNDASNGLLFASTGTQISSTDTAWWFENNMWLSDSTFFGSMYYTGVQTLQSATLNSWAKIIVTAPGYTGGYNERFTHLSGSLTYNGNVVNKNFKVTVAILLQNSTNNAKTVGAKIYKNGVEVPNTLSSLLLPNSNAIPVTLNMTSVVPMTRNDYIDIYVARTAGANNNYYVNSLSVTAEEL